jgi:15-cis-phytoene synthase
VTTTATPRPTVEQAYRICEDITRREARNFFYGIRLLPEAKRNALSAVYALARRVDDIGDGDLDPQAKLDALDGVRRQLGELDASSDPVDVAVADAAARLPIPLGAFVELVDGCTMDVQGTRYATFDDLVVYCRCVAGSIGRLCLGVFGASDMTVAPHLADSLGIALQQTNILRDIREDLAGGRVYLPLEDLDAHGVELRLDDSGALGADPGFDALVHAAATRNRQWYADGMRLIPLLDRRSAASAAAMAGIYRQLLERIDADPQQVRDRRLSLSTSAKLGVAARALAGRSA